MGGHVRQFAVCSIEGSTSLWTMQWDADNLALHVTASCTQLNRPFALAADPTGRWLYLVEFGDAATLVVLRRPHQNKTDYVVSERLPLPGASGACSVRISNDGSHLAIAGYDSANAVLVNLSGTGDSISSWETIALGGSGPDSERQTGSHPHDVLFHGDTLLVADLGADAVHQINLYDRSVHSSPLPAGSGPRHLTAVGDQLFVASGELDSTMMLLRLDQGEIHVLDSIPATSQLVPDRNYPSTVIADARKNLVYLANRGADSVMVARVVNERLVPVREVSTGGAWPEHLALCESHLLVAHSRGDSVVAIRLDDEGLPREDDVMARAHIPSAMWVEALPGVHR